MLSVRPASRFPVERPFDRRLSPLCVPRLRVPSSDSSRLPLPSPARPADSSAPKPTTAPSPPASCYRRRSLPTLLPAPGTAPPAKPGSPLPPASDPLFGDIFAATLCDCRARHTFQSRSLAHQKTKRLQAILQFLSLDGAALGGDQIDSLLNMILANVVRAIPAVSERLLVVGNSPLPPEPAWPHLSLVYQMLHQLLALRPRGEHFTPRVIRGVVAQIGSSFFPERDAIATFVFECARLAILPLAALLDLCEGAVLSWGGTVNERFALQGVMSAYLLIVKGSGGAVCPTKAFFEREVLASITSPYFGQFVTQVSEIVVFVAGLYPDVAQKTVRLIMRCWSHAFVDKQAACLRAIAEILRAGNADVDVVVALRPIIVEALRSPAFKVASAAIELLECGAVNGVLGTEEAGEFRSAVKAAVSEIAREHWSVSVREKVKPLFEAVMRLRDGGEGAEVAADRENGAVEKWVMVVEGVMGEGEERARIMEKLAAMNGMRGGMGSQNGREGARE